MHRGVTSPRCKRGTFSTVRIGVSVKSGELVAVKVIKKTTNDKKDMAAVENEIECWSLLDHPHIVTMKEVYDTTTSYCIVQELVTGGELFDKIVERSQYSEKDASELVLHILQAVNHMHERGVIHRDLKPENLLLSDKTDKAIIKLADFGLSCKTTDAKRMRKAVGTPGYISPEVLVSLEDPSIVCGKEVDIWAVGVIAFILLCGYPPFYAEDEETSFELTIMGQFEFASHSWTNISAEAKDLISHILVVDPASRYTAQQIIDHPWMKGNCPNAHLTETVTALKKFNARQKWKAAMAAAAALRKFAAAGKYCCLLRSQQQQ
eukprot:TRINITY_DN453_c0_g1_i1.p1 TRINITY_DN453_c0_g1~~TRINITY_DN453_c0_g1_i1.p1  ORF type:complete len:321 (+),score=94.41 TRINITY_DN453_c0_g1_i1:618-1580(+)